MTFVGRCVRWTFGFEFYRALNDASVHYNAQQIAFINCLLSVPAGSTATSRFHDKDLSKKGTKKKISGVENVRSRFPLG